jgi:hypothetical protein
VLVKAIGILAVATVGGPTTRLDVAYLARVGSKHTEKCFGVHRAGADFNVVRLLKYTAGLSPKVLQLQDELLEC